MEKQLIELRDDLAEVFKWLIRANKDGWNNYPDLIVYDNVVYSTDKIMLLRVEFKPDECPLKPGVYNVPAVGDDYIHVLPGDERDVPDGLKPDKVECHFYGKAETTAIRVTPFLLRKMLKLWLPAKLALFGDRLIVDFYEDEYHQLPTEVQSIRAVLMAVKEPIDGTA